MSTKYSYLNGIALKRRALEVSFLSGREGCRGGGIFVVVRVAILEGELADANQGPGAGDAENVEDDE